jgi:hypothetical protein
MANRRIILKTTECPIEEFLKYRIIVNAPRTSNHRITG